MSRVFNASVWAPVFVLFLTTVAVADDIERRQRIARTALTLWSLLALLSIVVLGVGGVWFIVRYRRLLKKRRQRPRVKYFDMSVGNEFGEYEILQKSDEAEESEDPEDHNEQDRPPTS